MLNKELLEQKLGKSIQEAGEKEIYFMLLELVKEMAKERAVSYTHLTLPTSQQV